MFTPQDLKKISFSSARFGGYVMKDVDKVLETLIADYKVLFDENNALKNQILLQKKRLEHEDQEVVTCKKCASKWTSRFSLGCCPFCGTPLNDVPILDPSSPVSVLSYIHSKYGSQVLCDKRLLSYFRDYAPGLQEQAALIGIAVDAGTYAEIIALDGVPSVERTHQILLCKERLKQKKFLADEYAQTTISWLVEALGWAQQEDQPQNSTGKHIHLNGFKNSKQATGVDDKPDLEMDSPSHGVSNEFSTFSHRDDSPKTPFRYRDCKMLVNKYGDGSLPFTIPAWFDGITEDALKEINTKTLYVPESIRIIHENALANAGHHLKTVLISSRNKWFSVSKGFITEKISGKKITVPDSISVRTYDE